MHNAYHEVGDALTTKAHRRRTQLQLYLSELWRSNNKQRLFGFELSLVREICVVEGFVASEGVKFISNEINKVYLELYWREWLL